MAKRDVEGFKREVRELCEKYRIGMVGTCQSEHIYGEITLYDLDNPQACSWEGVEGVALDFEDETEGWSQ